MCLVELAADPGEAVGPFTEADNTDLQVLGIPAVQGDSIVVEFTHPCDARQSQKGLPFVINKVSHGYKNFFGEDDQEEDAGEGVSIRLGIYYNEQKPPEE